MKSGEPYPRVAVLIPARLSSTRLPRKILADIWGRSMIEWVYHAARKADSIDDVYVVSGDEEVRDHCRERSLRFIASHQEHSTGTDRIAEAARSLAYSHFINVQGDEPTICPQAIDALSRELLKDSADLVTLGHPIKDETVLCNPNRVKIDLDESGRAFNFSRSLMTSKSGHPLWQHVGIYGFSRDRLMEFTQLPMTERSESERLEQLRALDAGWMIRVVETEWSGMGVDTQADLDSVRGRLMARGAAE